MTLRLATLADALELRRLWNAQAAEDNLAAGCHMALWDKDKAGLMLADSNRVILVDDGGKPKTLRGFVSWIWHKSGPACGDYAASDPTLGTAVRQQVSAGLFKAGFQMGLDRGVKEVLLSGPVGAGSYWWLKSLGLHPEERDGTAYWRVDMTASIGALR